MALAEKTEESSGSFGPNEMAVATPNTLIVESPW